MIKIAIFGYSGSGKSTATQIMQKYLIEKGKKVDIVKLAYPLYYLQSIFYEAAGKKIGFFEQDQILLEDIAGQLRRISPTSLADNFLSRLRLLKDTDVVINDDIRNYEYDYPVLKKEGFLFFRVQCSTEQRAKRLEARSDLSITMNSRTTLDLDKFEADYLLENEIPDIGILGGKIVSLLQGLGF